MEAPPKSNGERDILRASRDHCHLGGREGTASAAATAAINRAVTTDHPSAELRSVLSRRVP